MLSLLLAICISLSSTFPRLQEPRLQNEQRGENERRTVLRRKVVVNRDGILEGIKIDQNKTRVPEIGATLKEEEILLDGDNVKTTIAENRNSTTTNTTEDGSSPFTSLLFGFPNLPVLSELPLGIGWVAGVFDSLLPTVRHTQMPPHILL